MKRLGVDVGGTFTDLIYVDDEAGKVLVHKVPTTPGDPSQGTVSGIEELTAQAGESPAALEQVFHGTTIATNIVIEHNGARVGSVLVPLDEERARTEVRRLKEAGVEAIAVCFLFSFLNPAHEARVAEIVREEFPGAFLSVSSEVLPQYREYERFSTVCLNAYIGPRVSRYVRRLEQELEAMDVQTGLHLMTSASGVATAQGAIDRPVNLLMSGPVAGVVGGIWAGRQAGYDNVITLDVGR